MKSAKGIELIEFDPDLPPGPLNFDLILFVDIDGVFHPEGSLDNEMLWCFMANFGDVMDEIDPDREIPIVISSTWRVTDTLESIRENFPIRLRNQIVGVTPEEPAQPILGWDPDVRTGPQFDDGRRQREIERWMRDYAPAGDWLALDDRANIFSPGEPNLFLIPDVYEELGGGLNLYQCQLLKDFMKERLGIAPPGARGAPSI